jgi:uncharacterized membrane protein
MAWPIIVAWVHYVAIMLLIASLFDEHLLRPELTAAEARTVQRLDIVYAASADRDQQLDRNQFKRSR